MAQRGDISADKTMNSSLAGGDTLLAEGSSFGDYQVLELLGRGAMGVVYKCRHRTLDRLSALKVLNRRVGTDGSAGDPRFLREARATAQLDHHNIVSVYNAGEIQGQLYIEMQLVDGHPLSDEVEGQGLPADRATDYVEQIAHALHHAHSRGLIHRDIKPENILVSPDGVVKVADFGLAKHTVIDTAVTAPGSILGTPCYMAPEQWEGKPADVRTDLYALGGTLFHLVTGRPPYQGKLAELLRQHLEAPPPVAHDVNPAVPPAISAVITRLMAKRPEDRYQTASELIADLRKLRHTDGDAACVVASTPTMRIEPAPAAEVPLARRRRDWLALGALVLGVTVALLAAEHLGLWQRQAWRLEDQLLGSRPVTEAARQLPLVVIDDDTTNTLGWPIHNAKLADVLDALERVGARAVGVDLLLAHGGDRLGDQALADVTQQARRLVHAVYFFVGGDVGLSSELPGRFATPVAPAPELQRANRVTIPFEELLGASRSIGHTSLEVDADGVIRRVPLLINYRGKVYPALSLIAVAVSLGATVADIRWSPGEPVTVTPPHGELLSIPVDRRGALRISVRGTLEDRTRVSLREVHELVLAGASKRSELERRFRGRTVVLGTTLTGQTDIQPMPNMPAPYLIVAHAMAIETILGRDFIRSASWTALLLVPLLALAFALVGARLPATVGLLVVPVAVIGVWLVARLAIGRWGIALPIIGPCAAVFLGGLVGFGHRQWSERSQRRVLAEALGRYLPRKVANRILADPKVMRLGGQRRELSLLCVELHGFAALSEKLEPEEVGQLLQAFFGVVSDQVARFDGTVDRFSGEGVRAFFGDPVPHEDHACRAVSCGVEIRRSALRVLTAWASGGRPRPPLGVGVHTGYVTVGNIGTTLRMEYTVLGRNVEVAQRLAAAARDCVLVSARTQAITASAIVYEPRPCVADVEGETHEACAVR
jgi:class 3 adenylate cyclase/CHASE2 domain-containing sensor protein/tRNA A-37 threonylcarbamoyl transferase component Bud32